MKMVVFKGVNVTSQNIQAAINDFDNQYAETNEYDAWLDKKTYKYAVERNQKLYPCKHILSQATGIDTSEFNGGEQANKVFRNLGFNVIDKP